MERLEKPQLRMVWPIGTTEVALAVPRGYAVRTYAPGDEVCFLHLMAEANFDPWDDAKLHDNMAKIIPGGWFFAVEERSGAVVGTAMGLHNYTGRCPFTGDVGWLACDPAHRGRGLGHALTAHVTQRFLDAGYRRIQLHTEHYRLPAVRIYLKLGYLPMLESPEAGLLWEEVCAQIGWAFSPSRWQAGPTAQQPAAADALPRAAER